MDVATLDASAHDLSAALREDATESGVDDPHELVRRLYDDLRHLAHGHRARWRGNLTLNTTAIVHEAYLRVAPGGAYAGDLHFLRVASRAMRHVLINYAREQSAQKRGGGAAHLALDDAPPLALLSPAETDGLLGLDEALDRLAARDDRAARVVELRFFGGLSLDETADALGVSEATVSRDWRRARAWLLGELGEEPVLPAL